MMLEIEVQELKRKLKKQGQDLTQKKRKFETDYTDELMIFEGKNPAPI